jgi:hypothetical protein
VVTLDQISQGQSWFPLRMKSSIKILTVTQDGRDGIILGFSDGTTGGYVVEELLKLRPKREWTEPLPKGKGPLLADTSGPPHLPAKSSPGCVNSERKSPDLSGEPSMFRAGESG